MIMPVLCGVKASSTPTEKKLRFIHDCRFLNALLEKWHFSLEQLRDFVKCLTPGAGLIKIDLTSAYHHVEVSLRFRTLLGFNFDDTDYCWAVTPFGLGVAGCTFCRVVSVPVKVIRESGLTNALISYVDDLLASLRRARDGRAVAAIFEWFNFLINWAKTELEPSTRIEGLGFILDTARMAYDLPSSKYGVGRVSY